MQQTVLGAVQDGSLAVPAVKGTGLFLRGEKGELAFVPCSGQKCMDQKCLKGAYEEKGTKCSKGVPPQNRIIIRNGIPHLYVLRLPRRIPFTPKYDRVMAMA